MIIILLVVIVTSTPNLWRSKVGAKEFRLNWSRLKFSILVQDRLEVKSFHHSAALLWNVLASLLILLATLIISLM